MQAQNYTKQYLFAEGASGGAMKGEPNVRGTFIYDEPMSRHTSWRVGGLADRFFKPKDIDDVAAFLANVEPEEQITWVGLGSNLLVRDGGIRGTVISTSGLLNELELLDDTTIRVEAGVACGKAAKFAAKHHLVGAEFLAGIPGTIGGALAMNAGAFGGETWDWVKAVETLDRNGQKHLRSPEEYQVGYRSVKAPVENEWFVAAHFALNEGDGEASLENIKALLAKRNETQPTNKPSCGSVFRNPQDDFSARLIELAGLKGFCIGGACVSEKHANFIVNMGGATASDIEALINKVADTVEKSHGIRLVREVHIVGEALPTTVED